MGRFFLGCWSARAGTGTARCWLAVLLLTVAGCAPTDQDRVRDYNEDGVLLYQRGDYAGARDNFQAALGLRPEDTDIQYNLGQCYDRLGEAVIAERCYHECLQRAPNHPDCRYALAVLLIREGRSADAARMIEDWLKSEPKRATAYALDGWFWHQAGDLPRAQARLQQALELDPHDAWALAELGLVYEAMQRPDRARVLYERCLAVNPKHHAVAERLNRLTSRGVGPPKPD